MKANAAVMVLVLVSSAEASAQPLLDHLQQAEFQRRMEEMDRADRERAALRNQEALLQLEKERLELERQRDNSRIVQLPPTPQPSAAERTLARIDRGRWELAATASASKGSMKFWVDVAGVKRFGNGRFYEVLSDGSIDRMVTECRSRAAFYVDRGDAVTFTKDSVGAAIVRFVCQLK